ncbi:tyramine/octopamine receptor-like [Amphibalanus amphitrite]|uniref:tyramine/octopamine receptor-like n=1 Tax=Amphibalanus amphitrite TaxID=1232801 RepID=UPI001C92749E|nr:tyramine/octopamine receptor-like [Amphibalanus amphitrite]
MELIVFGTVFNSGSNDSGGTLPGPWNDTASLSTVGLSLVTETDPGAGGRPLAVAVAIASLMAFIALLGLAGNSLVVVVTIVDHDLKEHVSNIIIGNLALADLSTCLLVVLPSAGSLLADRWPFGPVLCWLHCGFNYLFIIVSMMSLALVSLDRKEAVEEPLQYIQRSRPSRLLAPLALIWSTGALFAIIPVALHWIHYDYWEGVCAIGWFQHRGTVLYVIVAFCVCFLIPASLIVWSNHIIVTTSHRVSRRHGSMRNTRDTVSTPSQKESTTLRRLYRSIRLRGRRFVRRSPGVSSSVRAAPVVPPAGATPLTRTRSEPQRSLRLDVSELVSGSHNIESMFSEFGEQRRRRQRDNSDLESEVATVHLPSEVRRRSALQPVIDTLTVRRPAQPAAQVGTEVNPEAVVAKISNGSEVRRGIRRIRRQGGEGIGGSGSSSDGSGDSRGGDDEAPVPEPVPPDPLSELESVAESGAAPARRAKIILRRQGSYVVESLPASLPRLVVRLAESRSCEGGSPAADLPDSLKRPLEAAQARPLTSGQERHLVRSHRRIIRSISIVVAIFFVCMTPFCVTKLVKIIFLREDLLPGWLNLLASVVQFMSSATNPFIYGFFRPDFKRAFLRIYRKMKLSSIISRQ